VKKIVCHPERSEGSDYTDVAVQILRFAQDDKLFSTRSEQTAGSEFTDVAIETLRFAQLPERGPGS
jgi:hypothetical protein